jgi:uncharacterized protein with HEPN domain
MLPRKQAKYLYDVLQACYLLQRFAEGKTLADYEADAMLRSAVERQFEIIGEALSQLTKVTPDVVSQIHEVRRIIAFRNILIHGYASVDDRVVWGVLQHDVPILCAQVEGMLGDADSHS